MNLDPFHIRILDDARWAADNACRFRPTSQDEARAADLVAAGLLETRGTWTRITEAGRAELARRKGAA